MIAVTCDICKKKIEGRYAPSTAIAKTLDGDRFVVTGPRYHIEVKDPLNDDLELDICNECHEKLSMMVTKLIKEENDGHYVNK